MDDTYKVNKLWATAVAIFTVSLFATITLVNHNNNARDITCIENGKSIVHTTLPGSDRTVEECK